jgi:methylthioribose-1-phosphate isomerase
MLPGKLRLIDQTRLPGELVYIETDDRDAIIDAIKRLVVRGAPALGCAAALGLAAVCQNSCAKSATAFVAEVRGHAAAIGAARPTAVNLAWAVNRCVRHLEERAGGGGRGARDGGTAAVAALKEALAREALAILDEDVALCRGIGENGVALFDERRGVGVLTHCNAGALAASDFGTALAPIYAAQERGLAPRVFADETRPLLQGARLTAWELRRARVDVTLICDNMAAQVMREGRVRLAIVGADRIAANGDTANKIGTYGVAVLARYHDIPFYVAAPYSTIDMNLAQGDRIPIEQRDADEVRRGFGRLTAPADCQVYNPAFDVTPAELITGIITERGILRAPYVESIRAFMARVG